eukprot:Tamp_26111.p1 GENE.Tamp_26111~~Tamp_26111.p1  ORF type:complete len:164 (-),score=23.00 Tamp_26111:65-556(-)
MPSDAASTCTATVPSPKPRDSAKVVPQGVEALVYNESSNAVELKEYRFALENLGFASVVHDLSDTQLHRLMTGPDSLYVEKDQLMDEKDAFRVYDIDGSGGISAQELSRIAGGLGTIIPPDRLEEALAKLGWIALRDVKGEVDAVTFEAWWKVVSVVVNIFYY